MLSTTPISPRCSPSRAKVQPARPSGGSEQAIIVRAASPAPSSLRGLRLACTRRSRAASRPSSTHRRRSADPRPASITAFNSPRSDSSSRTRHFSRLICVLFIPTAPNSDDRWAGPGQAGSDPIRTFPRFDPVLGSGPDYRPSGLKSTLGSDRTDTHSSIRNSTMPNH